MCGIAGVWGKSRRECLEHSLALLRHRGPDAQGIFEDKSRGVGLVHARLSILDPRPCGNQPMVSEDGKVVLTYNGEIYNYRELRRELENSECAIGSSPSNPLVNKTLAQNGPLGGGAKRGGWRGNSDTEVLLRLYLHSKERKKSFPQMLRQLNGIFAFAIWDGNSEELLLARDAFGVKPLYFASRQEQFVFGSEIKAMMPFLQAQGELDEVALERYLTFLWCPGEQTPNRLIRKINPGEFLRLRDANIIEKSSWFDLPCGRASPRPAVVQGPLTRALVRHLRRAVHLQMISDVPLGAFLSGGLDSSAVATFAREMDPSLRCFTIDAGQSSQEGFDHDLPYARKVAQHLKVQLEVIRVAPEQLAAGIEDMIYQLDEPLADPAPLHVLFICKLARQHGIKVLLSGVGGDDLFAGYRRHQALAWLRWLGRVPRPARSVLEQLTQQLPPNLPVARRLAKLLGAAQQANDGQLLELFRWIGRKELEALYSDSFRKSVEQTLAEQPLLDFLAGIPHDTSPLDRALALEQRFFLTDHNLLYTDKMSMAAGVEVRVPFLDPELVEFAARIPNSMKLRGRNGKWILKKAMEPFLPQEVVYRPKTGFGAPLRRWLRVELRDWLAETLSPERIRHRGLFRPEAVQKLIAHNAQGRVDATYTLFSLACIEVWCRRFQDGQGRRFA